MNWTWLTSGGDWNSLELSVSPNNSVDQPSQPNINTIESNINMTQSNINMTKSDINITQSDINITQSDINRTSVTTAINMHVLFENISTSVTWNSSADCNVVSYYFHVGVGLFVSVVAAFAIVGNVLVLCVYSRHSSLRTSSNFFIINLTIADLLMSILDFPMFAVSSFNGCWLLGYTGCQIYGSTTSIFSLVTINTLAVISFDRYFVVVHRLGPMHRMARSTTGLIILTVWLLSIMWSILPLMTFGSYRLEGMGTSCTFNYIDQSRPQRLFFICLVAFNFFIPLMLITYSYCRIFTYVKNVKDELKYLQRGSINSQKQHRLARNAETRTAVAVILIISIFCTAWTPYVIISFVGLFGPEGSITPMVSVVPNILAKVITVCNPILYTLGNKDMRNKVKTLLFGHDQMSTMRPTNATAGISSKDDSQNRDIPMHV